MSERTIQAVLFDIGNVVVRATHKITEAVFWDLGVRPDKAALLFHHPAYADFARGRIAGEHFARTIREALEAPHLTDALIRAAHDAHIYAVDEAVLDVLDALKTAGVPLAFVTTTNVWQNARVKIVTDPSIRTRPLTHYGPIAYSNTMGKTKTDPDAWPTILRTIGWQDRDPATILLVDDSAANCAAAKRAGLVVHQYDPAPVVGVEKLHAALREHGIAPK